MFPGMERAYVNYDYVQAITMAGAVPILLPVISDEQSIRKQIELVDGLLLSGGCDINPLCYNEEPCKELGFILPEVDEHQLAIVRIATELGKPMLGICRGIQILNVAFGGTLYQDVLQVPTTIKHTQRTQRHVPGHTVNIVQDTIMSSIFNKTAILTNSFHHQAVKNVAPGFIVNARSEDGVIEGIERPGDVFTLGVQWHPEMMAGKYPDMLKLFRKFIAATDLKGMNL
jgi:putative glutamine amidotransferase